MAEECRADAAVFDKKIQSIKANSPANQWKWNGNIAIYEEIRDELLGNACLYERLSKQRGEDTKAKIHVQIKEESYG